MSRRFDQSPTLSERLLLLATLGDDRNVAETYILGRRVKTSLPRELRMTEAYPRDLSATVASRRIRSGPRARASRCSSC